MGKLGILIVEFGLNEVGNVKSLNITVREQINISLYYSVHMLVCFLSFYWKRTKINDEH